MIAPKLPTRAPALLGAELGHPSAMQRQALILDGELAALPKGLGILLGDLAAIVKRKLIR